VLRGLLESAAVGDLDVVAPAEEDEVVEVGGAVVGPGVDVVDVALVAGDGAAGDDAADVAGVEGVLLRGARQPLRAAQVQDGAVVVEQGAPDPPRAGEHGQHGGVDGSGVLGVREPARCLAGMVLAHFLAQFRAHIVGRCAACV
jgi:hypothetical protein